MTKWIYSTILTLTILVCWQNCGQVGLHPMTNDVVQATSQSSPPGPQTQPEGPAPQPTKNPNCSSQKLLAAWQDPSESGDLTSKNFLGFILTYKGELSATANYNYQDDSGTPINGPAPAENRLTVFFYEDASGDIYFNILANMYTPVPKPVKGAPHTKIGHSSWKADFSISGNSLLDSVALSDDPTELTLSQTDKATSTNDYEGRWFYVDTNTDGGVIGPLRGSSESTTSGSKIVLKADGISASNLNDAKIFSSDGTTYDLYNPSNKKISSFVVTLESYQVCVPGSPEN